MSKENADDVSTQWVRESREGDLGAFGRLVSAHESPVSALLAQMMGTSAGAAVVRRAAADVFAAAWRDLGRLRDARNFPEWLFRRAVKAATHIPLGETGIDALPASERMAVRMHFTRRAGPEEAAQLLGCSVSEYWARLYDGCRRLAEDTGETPRP